MTGTRRARSNQPSRVPTHIRSKAVFMQCRNHDYIFYNEAWTDENTGVFYQKGYYDENGKYYDADSIAFKKPDGSYEAHYLCDFCGTELEANWKEGFYPTCKNCGAEMNKTPVYIDEIVHIGADSGQRNASANLVKVLLLVVLFSMIVPVVATVLIAFIMIKSTNIDENYDRNYYETSQTVQVEETETNLQIYGDEIYLDEVSPNTYRICTQQDDYEKYITWDYGAQSYYDYDSDCYLWYNTDVSPNLWQYWYEDIAGSNYYGWMECEGDDWYIEVSDTQWEKYQGDTSELWHIE